MLDIQNRTGEFRATVELLLQSRVGRDDPIVRRRTPTSADTSRHSDFMGRASRISANIQAICAQLEQLTKATRSKTSLLDDHKQAECIEMASAIESGIQGINQEIKGLKDSQREQPEQQHSSGVVVSLQSKLADATKTLAKVLKDREKIESEQRARRQLYSSGIKIPQNLALNDRNPLLEGGGERGERPLPSSHATSYQQLALVQSTDTSYLEARSAAVQGIEKSINEIGHIFQQLTHMISEQGDVVQRIDANIDDVGFNIDRGHVELLKYYNYVSSNRWLLLKMFAVLIAFMLLFNAFFL